jgi:hypothetical protein
MGNLFAGGGVVGIHVVPLLKAHNFEGVDIFEMRQVGVDWVNLYLCQIWPNLLTYLFIKR